MKKSQTPKTALQLLGGLSSEQFLADYWQKKPLLIRNAIPGFTGLLSPEELAGLACEEGVQSRLISNKNESWRVEEGPFPEARFLKLPKKHWTLLVQDVNHHLDEADRLLRQFSFIPYARLDDLMVSYAPDGGGVGPHFDSYDVFLLQGHGRRLWRISEQQDLALVEDAPLRILKNFDTQQEWLLEPGDMLYLPPHIAHWGIAVGDCMTYSIGFRAPSAQELVSEFLNYLQEKSVAKGMYADPDLRSQQHPAEIGIAMVAQVGSMLQDVQWDESDVASFLGQYLTAPKADVVFELPDFMEEAAFRQRLQREGLQLARKSQLLFHGGSFFMNGDQVELPASSQSILRDFADERRMLPSSEPEAALASQLYAWYLDGYVEFPEARHGSD
ncbi:MAG TPA: cupin domain-containing protein [Methylophilaceae bacterium]|nr:cupin domain-containing protein [Methylophilaceae bacterium]